MNTATLPLHGAVELTHWGVMRAKGQDAATFLHGQLSNDVKQLDGTHARLAGYCSPKGRLLATLLAWQPAPGEFWLACHRTVMPATLKRLSMFVLRADCRLTDAQAPTGEPKLWGLAGDTALQIASDLPVWGHRRMPEGSLTRLPDAAGTARALWVGPALSDAPPLSLDTWRWLEVHSAIPSIEMATSEQFVPQMVNFELLGGVNFQKGCYPGQEVVARSQYRGTLKRRMFLFDVDDTASLPTKAGQDVFHEDDPGQPAGMVVNAAPRPQGGGSALLVEVKLAAMEGGPLRLGHVEGPALVRQALPYDIASPTETSAS